MQDSLLHLKFVFLKNKNFRNKPSAFISVIFLQSSSHLTVFINPTFMQLSYLLLFATLEEHTYIYLGVSLIEHSKSGFQENMHRLNCTKNNCCNLQIHNVVENIKIFLGLQTS